MFPREKTERKWGKKRDFSDETEPVRTGVVEGVGSLFTMTKTDRNQFSVTKEGPGSARKKNRGRHLEAIFHKAGGWAGGIFTRKGLGGGGRLVKRQLTEPGIKGKGRR